MRKTHFRLLTGAGSMLAAGAIALSGTLAAAAAPSASSASGIEHFQIMSTSATATRDTVIAHGVFTAGGVDITTSNTTDTFKFPNGTIKVRHSPGTGPQSFNPHTCLITVRPARHLHTAERDRQVRRDQRPRGVPAGTSWPWAPGHTASASRTSHRSLSS